MKEIYVFVDMKEGAIGIGDKDGEFESFEEIIEKVGGDKRTISVLKRTILGVAQSPFACFDAARSLVYIDGLRGIDKIIEGTEHTERTDYFNGMEEDDTTPFGKAPEVFVARFNKAGAGMAILEGEKPEDNAGHYLLAAAALAAVLAGRLPMWMAPDRSSIAHVMARMAHSMIRGIMGEFKGWKGEEDSEEVVLPDNIESFLDELTKG